MEVPNSQNVLGEKAMPHKSVQNWPKRFKDGKFHLNGINRTERSSAFHGKRLNQPVHKDPRQLASELARHNWRE
ncbi:hypothetical protein RB195_022736 [Necator americanus]